MMSELSRFLLVSNGNVTGIVDRLESEGLAVARCRVEGDRRAIDGALTATAHARLRRPGRGARGLGRASSSATSPRARPTHSIEQLKAVRATACDAAG